MWDLQAALDPRAPAGTLCLRTLVVCGIIFNGLESHFHLKHQVQVDTFLKSEAFTIKLDFRKYPCYSHG